MATLVKRSQIVTWLNTNPAKVDAPVWGLVGNGMTTGSYKYDAAETSETYIVNDSATTTVDSYTVSLDGEMKCLFGDEVYDFINGLRYGLKVGEEAITQVLLVDKYDVTTGSTYKAQKFSCSISVSNYGGDGGKTPTISFKINVNGDPTNGTVTIANGTPTFTATA